MLGYRKPLGYQQITALSGATTLTVPSGATSAVIVAQTQSVRWRDDGTNPTGTVGMLLPVNTHFDYHGNLSAIAFIETAASAAINVSYYA